MKEWFAAHFPPDLQQRVPISLGNRGVFPSNDPFVFYDMTTGKVFDGSFHAGAASFLAIYSARQGRFLNALQVSGHTRGVDVLPVPNPENGMLAASLESIRTSYPALKQRAVRSNKIASPDEPIPFFIINVSPISRLEGVWQDIPAEEWRADDPMYRPTRGVHVIADGRTIRLGVVVELPARPGNVNQPRGGGPRKGRGRGDVLTLVKPYRERDPRVPVFYDENHRTLYLNPLYPAFARYNHPDEYNSPTQKLLSELYFSMKVIAEGISDGLKEPVNVSTVMAVQQEVDDDGKPIYEASRSDWTINKAIVKYLADDRQAIEVFEKVDQLRQSAVA
jgi:hypothetical protein